MEHNISDYQELLDEHQDGFLDSLSMKQQRPPLLGRGSSQAAGQTTSASGLPRLPSSFLLRGQGIRKTDRCSQPPSSNTPANLHRQALMNGSWLAHQNRMAPSSLARSATCVNRAEQLAIAKVTTPNLPRSTSTFSLPTMDASGDIAMQTEPTKDPRGRLADPNLTLDQVMSYIHEKITFASTVFRELATRVESSLQMFSKHAQTDPTHQVRTLYRELMSIALALRDSRPDWDIIRGMTGEFFFCVMPKLEVIVSSLRELVRYSCLRWMHIKILEPCEAIERRLRRIQDRPKLLALQMQDDPLLTELSDAMNEEHGGRDGDLSMSGALDDGDQAAPTANGEMEYQATVDDAMDEDF